MPLTTAQLTTIKADIDASSDLNSNSNTPDGNTVVAALYNTTVSPDFWVWRSSVTKSELTNSTSVDGTTFTWVGNGFITRSAGEQAAWRELFNGTNNVNPALPSVRQAFADIFSGSGNAAANRTHLNTVARRKASRIEKLLATGTGSTGSPATMNYEGPILYQDVEAARSLP
jgi:hypothetical protein